MENQNKTHLKVFGYFRVGNKSQLATDCPQNTAEKMVLDNRPKDADDIGKKESNLMPVMQIGG